MSRRGEIVGIQYLRGLAALGVVVDHAATLYAQPHYFGGAPSALVHGGVGVDLFFLISGFIISVVSLGEDLRPSVSAASYAWKRFVRIVPMMWLAIGSYALLRYLGRGVGDPLEYLRAASLWPTGSLMPNIIWTLRHEAMFYIVFALTMLGGKQRPTILAAWCLLPLAYAPLQGRLGLGASADELLLNLFHPLHLNFGIGAMIGVWLLRRRDASVVVLRIDPAWVFTALFVLLCGVAVLTDHAFERLETTLIAALLATPMVALAAVVKCPATLAGRTAEFLGAASYSIYLFHPAVESAVTGLWSGLAPSTPLWLFVPGLTLIVVVVCGAIHLWIERPLLATLRRARVPGRHGRADASGIGSVGGAAAPRG